MSKRVSFPSKSQAQASGEIVEPQGEGRVPALVVVQEWWGLNDHIRSLLERFANEGFLALAPDLYHGKVTNNPDEAGKLMAALNWSQALDEIDGAASYLANHPRSNGKVGIVGFCMGGALTFAAAANTPAFAAAVPFYGVPKEADWSKVKAPVLAHFSKTDQWAKPEAAEAIKKAIESHGGTMRLELYDAEHAFMNDTRPDVYSPQNAKLAWDRTVAFLKEHLKA